MHTILGSYSRLKYEILELDENGQICNELYTGGNHKLCSYTILAIDKETEHLRINLRIMRSFCSQTGREIAHERNLKFIGIERDTEDYFAST